MRKAKRAPKGEGLTVRKRRAKAYRDIKKRYDDVADRVERKHNNNLYGKGKDSE